MNWLGSSDFDVFCTANFLNFVPWRASVEYLLAIGTRRIQEHNRALAERLINGLDGAKYRLLSPLDAASAIVVISLVKPEGNLHLHSQLANAGIDIALRTGNSRFSLHCFNTSDEVDRALAVLTSFA